MSRFTLGHFDETEVREKMNAAYRATLEVTLVVQHADNITGADTVIFAKTQKEFHHTGFGGVSALRARLEIALPAFSLRPRFAGLTGFPRVTATVTSVVRGLRAVLGDLLALTSGRFTHQSLSLIHI